MKSEAYFLVNKGDADKAFELRSFEVEKPNGTEITIEAEAFGLNYADVMARRGLYREAPPMPCIIGYETVGKVVQCGPDANQELLNKRVVAFSRFGGYAKHVTTHDYAAVEVKEEAPGDLLALSTQAVTAFYMTHYLSPIHKGDVVLIHAAAGGVGTMLIQLAKMSGATVIAKIGREEKADLVNSLGADFVVNYNKSDYIQEINKFLNGRRLDVSYNPVGGATFKKDMSILGSGGRMVLFGGSELGKAKWGILSSLNFVRKMGLILPIGLMMRSKSILGVNMLKIADNKPHVIEACLKGIVELFNEKKIQPQVGGVFSHKKLAEAHDALESGNTTGKLVVLWD